LVYGLAHFLVDAACIGVLFSLINRQIFTAEVMTWLFITYNLLAFGLQVIIGFAVDTFEIPRQSAVIGLVLTGIASLIFSPLPVAAVITAGIGNALFHVGGGVISLNLTPRKATAPGIFVAPGALGVLVGTLLGKNGHFFAWPFILGMAALRILFFFIPQPTMYQKQTESKTTQPFNFEYIIYLVLFVVAVRSMVGFAVVFPWKTDINLLVILTLCVALGKGLGGFLADKFGWIRVAAGSLVLSIPLLTVGVSSPASGMIGMLLFNITMPVTLTMISNLLPGKPGTAFGLTCAALVLGTLPAFSTLQPSLTNQVFIDIVIGGSALALFFSLRLYHGNKIKPANFSPTVVKKRTLQEE
jgi:FSR family fosmidomycin resistance protein-like MFS transporter